MRVFVFVVAIETIGTDDDIKREEVEQDMYNKAVSKRSMEYVVDVCVLCCCSMYVCVVAAL